MIALKFLGLGAVGLFSGFRWPRGAWVSVEGPLVPGKNGVHASQPADLLRWLDDELWIIELGGEIREEADVLIASRGRLLTRLDAWDAQAALDFAEAAVWRMRGRLGGALAEGPNELRAVQAAAVDTAARKSGHVADALLYLADAVELLAGGRPDRYAGPTTAEPPTPGAIAANLGFVCAHAAGHLAAGPAADDALYAAGFEAERRRQLDWLVPRVELERMLELEPIQA